MGNVKANTELSYEFGVREGSPLRTSTHSGTLQVPFQLQVDHALPDGSHVMRVFTRWLPMTNDRQMAETGNVELSAIHHLHGLTLLTRIIHPTLRNTLFILPIFCKL